MHVNFRALSTKEAQLSKCMNLYTNFHTSSLIQGERLSLVQFPQFMKIPFELPFVVDVTSQQMMAGYYVGRRV